MSENDIVRVVRVLEYVGPRSWVDATFANNAVLKAGMRPIVQPGLGKSIQEIACSEQILVTEIPE